MLHVTHALKLFVAGYKYFIKKENQLEATIIVVSGWFIFWGSAKRGQFNINTRPLN
jgi:hypothetical protein